MACERYEDALTETAAGAPPAAGLESHLAGCARCREELAELRRTLALVDSDLRQLVAVEPSPELTVRIRQAVSEREPSPAWRPVWLWPALAAAAVLLLAFVMVTRREPTQPSVATIEGRAQDGTPTSGPARTTASVRVPAPVAAAPAVPRDHGPAEDRRRPAAPPEPAVLVPPGQVEALLRLATLVNRERVAPPVLASVDQVSPDLAQLRSIDITPLEIVPLDAAEESGT